MGVSLLYKGLKIANEIFIENLERKTGGKRFFCLQAISVFTCFIETIAQELLETLSKQKPYQ